MATQTIRDHHSRAGAHGERACYTCPRCGVTYDAAPGEPAPWCDCEDDVVVSRSSLADVLADLMRAYVDGEQPRPHSPAIIADADGQCEVRSMLTVGDGDSVVWDLTEGLGVWEPDHADPPPDIAEVARSAADVILRDAGYATTD